MDLIFKKYIIISYIINLKSNNKLLYLYNMNIKINNL